MGVIVVRRGGRARKAGPRHPGGKLHQASMQERHDKVASVERKARRRVHGLNHADASRPEAGDMFGRLFLSGEITAAQHAAGRAYAAMRTEYDRALGAQRLRSASGLLEQLGGGRARDPDDPEHVAWAERRRRAYEDTRRVLLACGDPLAEAVLDAVVLEEREMWNHVGTLRVALNAVGRILAPSAG